MKVVCQSITWRCLAIVLDLVQGKVFVFAVEVDAADFLGIADVEAQVVGGHEHGLHIAGVLDQVLDRGGGGIQQFHEHLQQVFDGSAQFVTLKQLDALVVAAFKGFLGPVLQGLVGFCGQVGCLEAFGVVVVFGGVFGVQVQQGVGHLGALAVGAEVGFLGQLQLELAVFLGGVQVALVHVRGADHCVLLVMELVVEQLLDFCRQNLQESDNSCLLDACLGVVLVEQDHGQEHQVIVGVGEVLFYVAAGCGKHGQHFGIGIEAVLADLDGLCQAADIGHAVICAAGYLVAVESGRPCVGQGFYRAVLVEQRAVRYPGVGEAENQFGNGAFFALAAKGQDVAGEQVRQRKVLGVILVRVLAGNLFCLVHLWNSFVYATKIFLDGMICPSPESMIFWTSPCLPAGR